MKRLVLVLMIAGTVWIGSSCQEGDVADTDADTTRIATPEMGLQTEPGESNVLHGSIMYVVARTIPSNSMVHLRLLSTSADSPPVMASEQVFSTEGRQPPIPFSIPVNWQQFDSTAQYELQAEIMAVDGTILYATEAGVPVLTHGNPDTVHVTLQPTSMQHPELPGEGDTGAIAP